MWHRPSSRWYLSSHLRIVVIDKVLEHEVVGILLHEIFCRGGVYFPDCVKHILPHILIPVLLKHLAWKSLLFVLRCMYKVAKVAPLAALRPMVILAWNGPVVADFDDLILNFLFFLVLLEIGILQGLDLAADALDGVLVIQA